MPDDADATPSSASPAPAEAAPPPAEDPGDPPYPQAPVVDKTEAIIVLLINIFVPGIGTIAGGILGEKPLIGRGIARR